MMNYIWGVIIIGSLIFAILTNKLDLVTNSMFDSTNQAIELTILMLGIISLWNGIMAILERTSIMSFLTKIISPFLSLIFKGVDKASKAYKYICLNFTANLLGLGNAATPLGLTAVTELEKTEKQSNSALKLILINTAALQLIPSTIIGLRSSLGSTNPNGIIFHIWICSIVSICTALIMYYLLTRKVS